MPKKIRCFRKNQQVIASIAAVSMTFNGASIYSNQIKIPEVVTNKEVSEIQLESIAVDELITNETVHEEIVFNTADYDHVYFNRSGTTLVAYRTLDKKGVLTEWKMVPVGTYFRFVGDGVTPEPMGITFEAATNYHIKLDNVFLDHREAGTVPITVGTNERHANAIIQLVGENKIYAGDYHAGIELQDEGTGVTIEDDPMEEGIGSLDISGGMEAAAIGQGAENRKYAGAIAINSGKVIARGGSHSAAIGGHDADVRSITIRGGDITAIAHDEGGIPIGTLSKATNAASDVGYIIFSGGTFVGIGGTGDLTNYAHPAKVIISNSEDETAPSIYLTHNNADFGQLLDVKDITNTTDKLLVMANFKETITNGDSIILKPIDGSEEIIIPSGTGITGFTTLIDKGYYKMVKRDIEGVEIPLKGITSGVIHEPFTSLYVMDIDTNKRITLDDISSLEAEDEEVTLTLKSLNVADEPIVFKVLSGEKFFIPINVFGDYPNWINSWTDGTNDYGNLVEITSSTTLIAKSYGQERIDLSQLTEEVILQSNQGKATYKIGDEERMYIAPLEFVGETTDPNVWIEARSGNHTILLNNVNIDHSESKVRGAAPITQLEDRSGARTLTIELQGKNIIKGGYETAGIQLYGGTDETVRIIDHKGDDTIGELEVYGNTSGAGIGNGNSSSASIGSIVIGDGTGSGNSEIKGGVKVVAYGAGYAPGIGNAGAAVQTIELNNAHVESYGGSEAVAIGGSGRADRGVENFIITDGYLYGEGGAEDTAIIYAPIKNVTFNGKPEVVLTNAGTTGEVFRATNIHNNTGNALFKATRDTNAVAGARLAFKPIVAPYEAIKEVEVQVNTGYKGVLALIQNNLYEIWSKAPIQGAEGAYDEAVRVKAERVGNSHSQAVFALGGEMEAMVYTKMQDLTADDTLYEVTFHENLNESKEKYVFSRLEEESISFEQPLFNGGQQSIHHWNTKPDGTGKQYDASHITGEAKDLDLYAKWEYMLDLSTLEDDLYLKTIGGVNYYKIGVSGEKVMYEDRLYLTSSDSQSQGDYSIVVENGEHHILLDEVTISAKDGRGAIEILDGTLNMELRGENELYSHSDGNGVGRAAIDLGGKNAHVTIYGENPSRDTLIATGSNNHPAIGTSRYAGGQIVIDDVKIVASTNGETLIGGTSSAPVSHITFKGNPELHGYTQGNHSGVVADRIINESTKQLLSWSYSNEKPIASNQTIRLMHANTGESLEIEQASSETVTYKTTTSFVEEGSYKLYVDGIQQKMASDPDTSNFLKTLVVNGTAKHYYDVEDGIGEARSLVIHNTLTNTESVVEVALKVGELTIAVEPDIYRDDEKYLVGLTGTPQDGGNNLGFNVDLTKLIADDEGKYHLYTKWIDVIDLTEEWIDGVVLRERGSQYQFSLNGGKDFAVYDGQIHITSHGQKVQEKISIISGSHAVLLDEVHLETNSNAPLEVVDGEVAIEYCGNNTIKTTANDGIFIDLGHITFSGSRTGKDTLDIMAGNYSINGTGSVTIEGDDSIYLPQGTTEGILFKIANDAMTHVDAGVIATKAYDEGNLPWGGIFYEANVGGIGRSITLEEGYVIPVGKVFSIPKDAVLTLANGATLENNGTLRLEGGTIASELDLLGNGKFETAITNEMIEVEQDFIYTGEAIVPNYTVTNPIYLGKEFSLNTDLVYEEVPVAVDNINVGTGKLVYIAKTGVEADHLVKTFNIEKAVPTVQVTSEAVVSYVLGEAGNEVEISAIITGPQGQEVEEGKVTIKQNGEVLSSEERFTGNPFSYSYQVKTDGDLLIEVIYQGTDNYTEATGATTFAIGRPSPQVTTLSVQPNGATYTATIKEPADIPVDVYTAYEYSFDGENWSAHNIKEEIIPGETVQGFIRYQATETLAASPSVATNTIVTNKAPNIPVISTGGVFEEIVEVSIQSEEGGTIYYTLDGTDPEVSSTRLVYDKPFELTKREVVTVNAVVYKEHTVYSEMASETFEVIDRIPRYQLTIVGGEGSGEYKAGEEVTITATPPRGHLFIGWKELMVEDETPDTTTDSAIGVTTPSQLRVAKKQNELPPLTLVFTMPEADMTLTAVFEEDPSARYEVSVEGGQGSGFYAKGAEVTITAEVPKGYGFAGWEVVEGEAELADWASQTTTFVMPREDIRLVAKIIPTIGTVDKPVITPNGGTFKNSLRVEIIAPQNATIYYTTNGETPTVESQVYTGPITLTRTTVLKAMAVIDDTFTSDIAEARFTKRKVVSVTPPSVNTPSDQSSGGNEVNNEADNTLEKVISELSKAEKQMITEKIEDETPYTGFSVELTIEQLKKATGDLFTLEQLEVIQADPELLELLGLNEVLKTQIVTLKPVVNPYFEDVQEAHWAHETIHLAAELGLVAGVTENFFAPSQWLQVADTFTFLDRVLLLNNVGEMRLPRSIVETYLVDDTHWAFPHMASIGAKLTEETLEIVSELGEAPLTRGFMAQVLYEILADTLEITGETVDFVDTALSPYQEGIDFCVRTGLLVGTSETTMSPNKTLTRAEIMAIVIRINNLLKSDKAMD